jgi:hypothetical protein
MWWALEKQSPNKYITLIIDMHDNVVTSVRTSDGDTDNFPIQIGLHQRFSHGQGCVELSYPRARTITWFQYLMGFNSSLPQLVWD